MSDGTMTEAEFVRRRGVFSEHPKGCTYGGFSCGYWLIADGCELEHWEKHIVLDGHCPCGTEYPGAGRTVVFFDASDDDSGEQDGTG